MKKRRKQIIALLMASMILTASGCNDAETTEASASIELVEPVNAAANTETAAYRDFYDYKVVAGTVYPFVQEYSFGQNVVLTEYEKAPGASVSKGSTLVLADDTSIEQQIESLEEKIEQLTENYQDAEDALQKEIKKEKEEQEKLAEEERKQKEKEAEEEAERKQNGQQEETMQDPAVLEAMKKAKEEQETAKKKAEEMQKKQQEYTDRSRKMAQSHRAELYQLDLDYYTSCLNVLKQKQTTYQLTSGMSGKVVSVGQNMPGNYIEGETPLVAVADDTQKIVRCEYINKTDVAKSEDIYAFVNGKRYEVTYQPYDQAEYKKLTAEGNVVYSSFVIDDPEDEVKQGDFAVLAVIYGRQEQVLSIPKNALHDDAAGSYVYCVVNGENQYTRVKTGKNDGTYIEITDGLKEGDSVLIPDSVATGSKTTEVTRGDFSGQFEGSGFIHYPLSDYVTNPVEYGTVCFTKYQADLFQVVKAGDVIAEIHVKADEASILEKQLKLTRMQERLQDMITYQEDEKLIARKQEEIAELMETLAQMQADAGTKVIKAKTGGIVSWLADYSVEDEIEKGAPIAMIVNGSECFLTVKNENQQLNYGNTVTIEYTDLNQEKRQAEGTVVTLGAAGLSSGLKSEDAYICIPEDVSDFIQEKIASGNIMDFFQRPQFTIKTRIRTMTGVLLVPKKAVTVKNGKTYVYVKQADGTITAQSFIAGGSNDTEYWVLEGLEEGMTICLE